MSCNFKSRYRVWRRIIPYVTLLELTFTVKTKISDPQNNSLLRLISKDETRMVKTGGHFTIY